MEFKDIWNTLGSFIILILGCSLVCNLEIYKFTVPYFGILYVPHIKVV